ncbi:MAG: MBL fold metallo-hydrolase, partial [Candidatus Bathyarchaeota archaeon]
MLITKVSEHLHQIDLEPAGIKGFVASYVLKGKNVAIVEAGPMASVQNLKRALDELGVNLEEILFVAATHIHLDHSGASGRLLKYLPNAKLIVHHRGAPHAANPEKLWAQAQEALGEVAQIYGKPEPVPEDRIIAAEDGMSFNIGDGVKLEVVETLGHASHHLSYHEKLSGGIFTGDAAGVYLSEFNLVVPTT